MAEKISAQDTIGYRAMYQDGVCRVNERTYTKTVEFFDINYQLVKDDEREKIFKSYCGFLNCFDESVTVQLSFINRRGDVSKREETAIKALQKTLTKDDILTFGILRREYLEILKSAVNKNGNAEKRKYITFGVTASTVKEARQNLARIEANVIASFKQMGVKTYVLNGYDRLKLLHGFLNPGKRFDFSWDLLRQTGLSTKDFIAPNSFSFSGGHDFKMGEIYGATAYLQILAPELCDNFLKELLDSSDNIAVNIHLKSIDQADAIRFVKRKITDIERMKVDEQKRASKEGYDNSIIPIDIEIFGIDAKKLLEDLQEHNERLFTASVLVTNTAKTKAELKNDISNAETAAGQRNCKLRRLDYRQEEGLNASIPIGYEVSDIGRDLTTSAVAAFTPFATKELFSKSSEALYVGLNSFSGNVIFVDRKELKNPNGLILGTPGSGKSFAAKREVFSVFLCTDDDIYISDAEDEYSSLVKALGGQIITFSPTSHDYINPLDITLDERENPLALKCDFILSFCELAAGEKQTLRPIAKTVIDRAAAKIYKKYFANPVPENMPVLEDLYNELKRQPEPEAIETASALELYVKGSLSFFNHRTNVNIDNRLVSFDIKDLGSHLKALGMLTVQEQIWNRVGKNRRIGKATRYFADEFHLLLRDAQTASYSADIWKRFRKWGGIPTGITQNVKDLLLSPEAENIFENSDYVMMFNQAAGDREILAKRLGISDQQLSYVTQSNVGEGLLSFGDTVVPFIDRFPKDSRLYHLITTKPKEVD